MDSFKKVERRYNALPVTLPNYLNASGVLTLDRGRTVLETLGDFPIAPESAQGWFDVRVAVANGRELLLHNAIVTHQSFSQRGLGREGRQTTLFPNVIIEDASALTVDNRVRSIQFRLQGWGAFFCYDFSESLGVTDATPELIESLKKLRINDRDGIFQPDQIHVVHRFPKLIDFTLENRTYSVWAGKWEQGGFGRSIRVLIDPIGSIQFDEPVSIETAINACWDWRRYFSQLAMAPLAFTAMSVQAELIEPTAHGNVYLPNAKKSEKRKRRDQPTPYYMPLNRWHEREHASTAMQTWLSRQSERRVFRAALNRVLSRFAKRIALQDIVELCAAIESLETLNLPDEIPKEAREAMAKAARQAAFAHQIDVEEDRLKGLLGTLQRASLAHRMKRMAEIVDPTLDVGQLVKRTGAFRQVGAHGVTMYQETETYVAPVIQALVALCVRYDLQDAGVPMQTASDARCLPAIELERAMSKLRDSSEKIS